MILYIGNKLSKHGFTPTNIETLGPQLSEFFEVVCVSDKRNRVARMCDMVVSVFRYRKRADKVIIDTYSTSNFYFAVVAAGLCRLFKIPYIPILHGGSLPSRLDRSKRLSAFIFRHSLTNVSPSGYLKYEFERRGYGNVVLIPNNIDLSNYRFKVRRSFAPRLLWVRSFASLYNPTMAIRVLSELKRYYPNAVLCMVGQDKDGSMGMCRELAKVSGIEDSVIFTGKLPKVEWIRLSGDYDIFINTTNVDNTPVSVIEAMALGLPVVSTNVGGIPFLIEDNREGILVPPNGVSEMVARICELIGDPVWGCSLVQNAYDKVRCFGWDCVRLSWFNLLS